METIKPEDVRFHLGRTAEQTAADMLAQHASEVERAENTLAFIRSRPPKLEHIALAAECVAKLRNNGFDVSDPSPYHMTLRVESSQLGDVRKALGEPIKKGFSDVGSDDRHVLVHLNCERYPMLDITYERAIEPGSPCQIVTETHVQRKLVCSTEPSIAVPQYSDAAEYSHTVDMDAAHAGS